ncbi:hypothetical protein VNO77_41834 [Canavalia gladiata]|uniref:Wall-associated receptor kinase galacturonan-binding domain-containing protein n=1 Tax=Canavalia gladiata TaxID=3824 RepID=A0AAN9K1K6_CANGL
MFECIDYKREESKSLRIISCYMMALGLVPSLLLLCGCLRLLSGEECPPNFSCGDLGELQFPFTNTKNPECGFFVGGCDEQGPAILLENVNQNQRWLQIESIDYASQSLLLFVRDRLLDKIMPMVMSGNCSALEYINITLPPASVIMSFEKKFEYTLTLCKCNQSLQVTPPEYFSNYMYCDDTNYYVDGEPQYEYLLYYGLLIGDALPNAFNGCAIYQVPASSVPLSNFGTPYALDYTLKHACMAISLPDVGRDELFYLDITGPSLDEYLNSCTGEISMLITPSR